MELNLVGVVVVVIGVNFLRIVFQPCDTNLLNYGIGYAATIAALSDFIAVRSTVQHAKEASRSRTEHADHRVEEP